MVSRRFSSAPWPFADIGQRYRRSGSPWPFADIRQRYRRSGSRYRGRRCGWSFEPTCLSIQLVTTLARTLGRSVEMLAARYVARQVIQVGHRLHAGSSVPSTAWSERLVDATGLRLCEACVGASNHGLFLFRLLGLLLFGAFWQRLCSKDAPSLPEGWPKSLLQKDGQCALEKRIHNLVIFSAEPLLTFLLVVHLQPTHLGVAFFASRRKPRCSVPTQQISLHIQALKNRVRIN